MVTSFYSTAVLRHRSLHSLATRSIRTLNFSKLTKAPSPVVMSSISVAKRHFSPTITPLMGRSNDVMQPTAKGMKTTWFMNLMQQVSASRLFSEKLKIELYPPFFMMRIKVLELRNQWRRVRVRLPLNIFSRNPGGVMFGGYQAALADPVAALACSRIFPGYSCWTRAMSVDFKLGGSTDLELRFDFPPELEEQIRKDLKSKGRSTPTFEYGYYLKDGLLCTQIKNTVAIRPRGYIGATTPPAMEEFKR